MDSIRWATLVVALGVVAVAVVAAVRPAPETMADAHLTVECDVDICFAEASYRLPVPHDGHPLVWRWETAPAARFDGNAADVVERWTIAGAAQVPSGPTAYRYTVRELIWHSDIRCDDVVTVTLWAASSEPVSATTMKPVPDTEPPYCSDHGMDDERVDLAG